MTNSSPSILGSLAGQPRRRRTWIFVLVIVFGTCFLAWESYVMIPALRIGVVKLLGGLGRLPTVRGYLLDPLVKEQAREALNRIEK